MQRALSCVTLEVVRPSPNGYDPGGPHTLVLSKGLAVPVGGDVALRMFHQYSVVPASGTHGPWKVSTVGYVYAIEDLEERELFAYHWHPDTADADVAKTPHLHVSGEHERLHLPTGRVSMERVVRLAVELGCSTIRADWEKVLDETEAEFVAHRTWP
jgi:hypothetical protein